MALSEERLNMITDALNEKVNHPQHYTNGKIETIEYIESCLTKEEYRGYIKGNVLKYISREKFKNGNEDLRKALWYLNRLLMVEEQQERDFASSAKIGIRSNNTHTEQSGTLDVLNQTKHDCQCVKKNKEITTKIEDEIQRTLHPEVTGYIMRYY